MRERERQNDGDAPESLKTEIVPFERDLLSSPRQGREEEELPPPSLMPLEQRALRPRSANGNGLPLPSAERSFVKRVECDAAREGGGEGDLPGRFLWRELRRLVKACNDVVFFTSSFSIPSRYERRVSKILASSIRRKKCSVISWTGHAFTKRRFVSAGGSTMNEKRCWQNGVNYSGYLKRPLKQCHCHKARKNPG